MMKMIPEILPILTTLLQGALVLLGLALAAAHLAETWEVPEYPHSGFCPDCPVWVQEGGLR